MSKQVLIMQCESDWDWIVFSDFSVSFIEKRAWGAGVAIRGRLWNRESHWGVQECGATLEPTMKSFTTRQRHKHLAGHERYAILWGPCLPSFYMQCHDRDRNKHKSPHCKKGDTCVPQVTLDSYPWTDFVFLHNLINTRAVTETKVTAADINGHGDLASPWPKTQITKKKVKKVTE